ncbi:uncharacterized protein LOC109430335 [Aedes albopictus]|uniref:Secreted protein n=1 Tax=Aedes albopictus TaxID=7160 RepID=A0ABM1YGU4_AEDAL
MKAPICILLLAASLGLVLGGACNIGVGQRQSGEFQMYTIHAAKGPLAEAQIISLTFDYQVNPIDTVEITYVDINTSLQNQCSTSFPTAGFGREFQITVSTMSPVTEFSGSATVYGVRRIQN